MKRFLLHPLTLTLGLVILLQIAVVAKFVSPDSVPVDRLIANVEKQRQKAPKDANVVYTLGRLHSLAFAQGNETVFIYPSDWSKHPDQLPQFPSYDTPRVTPDDTLKKRKAEALAHLRQCFQLYRRAMELAPKDALTQFSYAWMLEQGSAFAAEVDAPFRDNPTKANKTAWREEALKTYRRAFALSKEEDAKRAHVFMGAETLVSVEAGQSILDIYKNRSLTKAETEEKKRIEAHLAHINKFPRAVTPLVFPMNGRESLSTLTATQTRVKFNLMGDSNPRVWPWVTPQTGILVWDPAHTGRITSGRQLFGSVTWWIFWKNGYEPLAALDNNRSGWLEGSELKGIAVWQDKNSNGISEKGEVTPIEKLAIRRIAVHPTGRRDGTLTHSAGVVMQDGSTRPLYDWTPNSLPNAPDER